MMKSFRKQSLAGGGGGERKNQACLVLRTATAADLRGVEVMRRTSFSNALRSDAGREGKLPASSG